MPGAFNWRIKVKSTVGQKSQSALFDFCATSRRPTEWRHQDRTGQDRTGQDSQSVSRGHHAITTKEKKVVVRKEKREESKSLHGVCFVRERQGWSGYWG